MMASDEVIIQLAELSIKTVTSAIKAIQEYKRQNTYFPTYYQYPERFLKGIEKTVDYNEMKEKIPAFRYGIPFFIMHGYNNPKNYGDLLSGNDGRFSINCHALEGFDELLSVLQADEQARRRFTDNDNYVQGVLVSFIGNIANRYFYTKDDPDNEAIDESTIKELVFAQFNRLFLEKLNVHICIPICFIEFESEHIELSESISICKMSDDFQISRYNASHFESTPESNIAQCASYMICLDNYSISNADKESIHNSTKNSWSYPTEVINDIFAAIRIAVGAKTGYGQLLIEPINWADKWTGNLLPLYGTNIIAFNRNEVNTTFFGYEITVIKDSEIQLIRDIFTTIQSNRIKEKKDSFNKAFIAIQRLNRCMLREADDDTALDAIIGIEALLSGDTFGEITYTISNRMAIVASKTKECPYTPAETRKAMKKIYGLRSDIVHGRDPQKNSTIIFMNKEFSTKALAVDFLRFSLLFIIRNPEFLDVKKFESTLDDKLIEN